ncbi:MAG: formate acetyltransferase [Myxococcales bacterium SG8_38]|nr:MAG: formate acetyltransferase [Myxococcales bacterium SG8_38]
MLEAFQSSPTSPGARVLTPQEARIERGEPIGLVGDGAQSKRARIQRMLEGFREQPIRLNVERARLLTESMKTSEGQPMVLRWAKALAHILEHHPIHIEQDEILVGSAGPPGRYAVVYSELVGPGRFYTHPYELVPSKPGDPIEMTEQDVATLKEEILPYWEANSYHKAIMNALPEETRCLMERIFVVTPTASGRSMLAWAHDYEKVLERGIASIRDEAARRLDALDPFDAKAQVESRPFLEAVGLVGDAMIAFARRYGELAAAMAESEPGEERRRELREIAAVCQRVPEHPARTFHEAVQSQWFVQTVSRLEQAVGGVVGNGRIDQYLYPYYRQDIDEGRLTEDEALVLLESIWVGMARSVDVYAKPGMPSLTDGFAHWEATTVGGLTPDGRDASNELSYLILKSKREFPLNYPDLAARIHARTPNAFLHAVCETIKDGSGFPKLFCDDEIIPLLVAKGGTLEEANDYCITGCSETKMLNREGIATGCAWINLGAILEMTLRNGRMNCYGNSLVGLQTGDPRTFQSFDEMWNAFTRQLENVVRHTFIQQYVADTLKSRYIASPMFSMLHDLCMADCKDIHSGPIEGALYLGFFDVMGFGTVIDSLAALRTLVFEEGKLSMDTLLEALDHDFEGYEAVRQMCLNAPKYGNYDPEVDRIGHDIEARFIDLARAHKTAFGGELDLRYVSVTSHIPLGAVVGATPDGRKAREPLSESISPSQGRDVRGPTATLASISATKCAQHKERAARLLNMKLSPASIAGEAGTRKLMALVRTACDMRMWHIQFNIVNRDTLLAAQRDPEKYRNLLVRVAGYSAYFVDLTPALQSEIIRRTEHEF